MGPTKLEPAVALAELQESKPDRVTIVVLSGDFDRVMAAFIIGLTALIASLYLPLLGPEQRLAPAPQFT